VADAALPRDNARRTLGLLKKTIDALYAINGRLQKLEAKERSRVITGFADAVACEPCEPYRDVEEIAEDEDGPVIG
jgi:hypothetical protein